MIWISNSKRIDAMPQPLHFLRFLAISMMALVFALPAAAAADDDYASALSREASNNRIVSVSRTVSVDRSQYQGSLMNQQEDPADVRAARLGVITPYGKNALVQELRAYYPSSYRFFRGLDRSKVQVLVNEFENTGDVVKVLSLMDKMQDN